MKRYAFDGSRGEMFEIAQGAYVRVEDAEQLQQRITELELAEATQAADLERLRVENADVWTRYRMALDVSKAAEARLAEATALVQQWCAAARFDGEDYGSLYDASFKLSAAPALSPLKLVEDRTPEQLVADGDAEPTHDAWGNLTPEHMRRTAPRPEK